jgi:hypothetical protein
MYLRHNLRSSSMSLDNYRQAWLQWHVGGAGGSVPENTERLSPNHSDNMYSKQQCAGTVFNKKN